MSENFECLQKRKKHSDKDVAQTKITLYCMYSSKVKFVVWLHVFNTTVHIEMVTQFFGMEEDTRETGENRPLSAN